MSEENKDMTPRRRRTDRPETGEPAAAGTVREAAAAAPGDGRTAGERRFRRSDAASPATPESSVPAAPEKTAQTQGPYSRVPEEARRMSASPYGAISAAAVRHPSANPAGVRERKTAPHAGEGDRKENGQSVYQKPSRSTAEGSTSRVRVGYAPVRMNEGRTTEARPAAGRPMPARPAQEMSTPPEQKRRKGTALHVLAALLVVAGAFLAVMLMLPEDNDLRQQTAALARKATKGIEALAEKEPETPAEAPAVTADQFETVDNMQQLFGTGAGSAPEEVENVPAETETAGTENNRVPDESAQETAAAGQLPEETAGEAETDTAAGRETTIFSLNPDQEPGSEATSEDTAGEMSEETSEEITEETSEDIFGWDTGAGTEPASETAQAETEGQEAEEGSDPGTDTPDNPESGSLTEAASETDPDQETEPEPQPVVVQVLTAEAVPTADPELIKTVEVFDGKKKLKEYSRPAKDLIRMPSGWEYTKRQIGVLTFRGNAFRTNGAVGTVESAGLSLLWTAESGSVKGSKQTYYGTGWTGQPAIVKWSKQIREASNIYDTQKSEGMKEVIVAGLDGNIRFLNLENGEATRNSVKLGYPMRGTPSLHPSGFPYMSVGQYARNMKSGTGKIGLRQYNLYTQNEITLIDGTDKSMNRAYNSTGSFETSALIDRTSDTAVIAGSNGLLYLISLNSDFDWQIGIYKSKQSVIVMRSKTSGQKKEMTAVESSLAMYNRYVFYADMGGILRCVDTNFLTPVWAVDTQDAVMAAVALDMPNAETLDLYTANMLKNRKSGNAQIRRYNALSGKEIWCTEIGVKKDKKNNTDSGCKASPVIGENGLSDLVFFTVTGLSDEGRSLLKLPEETKAATVALEKETGSIRWAYGLSDRSESSPIAVYDGSGNGWIIQCAWDGTIVMLEGLTGNPVSTYQVEGNIEASPAAYNDIMVIGTTGKGTEHIYGIKIGPAKNEAAE